MSKTYLSDTRLQYLLSKIKTWCDSKFNDKANVVHTHTTSNITDFPTLSTVATSGSYNDLSNKPTIPDPITVDTELSDTSTNPVQNRVVKSAIDSKADASDVTSIDTRVGTLEDNQNNVIKLTSSDDLNNIIDITKKYCWASTSLPSNVPITTNYMYMEVMYDYSATSARRRQIAYIIGTHKRYERTRNESGNWDAWIRIDTSNLIVASESKTYDVSFTAGTIGTRAVSDEVDISKSGYTVIGVNLINNSASASFNVNLMARPDTNKLQIRCYRATSSAVSNAYIQYQIIYIRN